MAKKSAKPDPRESGKEEEVFTPGGWRPKSQVQIIEQGYHISAKGGKLRKINTQTGKVVEDYGEIPKLPPGERYRRYSEFKPGGKKLATLPGATLPAPETDDWIVNSGWTNNTGNPISYFSTRWIVPPAPTTDNGQIIFLFNGLETSNGQFILQPVLQWGSNGLFGGSYWCIANWYADGQGGTYFVSTSVQVNPGDVLHGIMTLTNHSGNNFDYMSSFDGHSNIDLQVTNIDELVWANETLECYKFKQYSDYPDAALTAFYDIEIRLRTQETPTIIDSQATINWTAQNHHTDNGQQCLIVSNDSPGGVVYLYYRSVWQDMYFVNDKSTLGKDEVTDTIADAGGWFYNAFWVMLEGYTINQLSIDQPTPLKPLLSGTFSAISGVTITPNSSSPEYELPGDLYTPQRIRFPFDIRFTSPALSAFPSTESW